MTEEIEIEEHNLFESPVVKKLFPDVYVLKHEILQASQNYRAQPESTSSAQTSNNYEYNIKLEKYVSDDEDVYFSDTEALDTNVLALENEDSYQSTWQSFVWGSKPDIPKYNIEELQAKIMKMNIVIKDVEPYLVRSKRFCNKCLILFPDSRNLDLHNLKYHISEIAHDTNQQVGHRQHGSAIDNKSIQLYQNLLTNNDIATVQSKTARGSKVTEIKRIYMCQLCAYIFSNAYDLFRHKKEQHHDINIMVLKTMEQEINHEGDIPFVHENTEVQGSSDIVEDILTSDTIEEYKKRKEELDYKIMKMNIVIKDVKSYLVRSKRFCNKCLILFPDSRNLDLHNLKYHIPEIAHSTNQQVGHRKHESAIDNKSIHLYQNILTNNDTSMAQSKTSRGSKVTEIKRIYKCQLCPYIFSNAFDLFQHKKEQHHDINIMTSKTMEQEIDHEGDIPFVYENTEVQGSSDIVEDVLTSDTIEEYRKAIEKLDSKIKKVYQCKICQKFTPNSLALAQHENEHVKVEENNIVSVYPRSHENEEYSNENLDTNLSTHIVEDLPTSEEPSNKQFKLDMENGNKIRKIYQCKLCHNFYRTNNDFEKHECLNQSKNNSKCKADSSEQHLPANRKRTNTVTSNDANTNIEGKQLYPGTKSPMLGRNSYSRDNHEKVHEQHKEVTSYECDICYLVYPSSYKLKRHRYIQHKHIKRNRNSRNRNIKRQREGVISEKTINQKEFPCNICKRVFKLEVNLKKHNSRNKCKRRKQKVKSVKINEQITKTSTHIYQCRNKLLKSVLYKCQKCDVHFMFAKTAENHEQHMDMLVNWKCSTCSRIFKIQDKKLHLIQHKVENDINVYNLTSEELSKVLYNCPKCTLHFSEVEYLNHYNLCGVNISKSIYCRPCDILVEQKSMLLHNFHHEKGVPSDIKIIVTEVIKAHKLKDTNKSSNRFQTIKIYYCTDCNSYVSKLNMHYSSVCINMKKKFCKFCGLPIPTEDMANHGKIHTVYGDIKISNFIFLNIKSGSKVTPPVPSFPRCDSCQVHFISEAAVKRHICGDKESAHCTICDKKFTNVAFRLHVPFHHLSNPVSKTKSNSTVKAVKTVEDTKKIVLENIQLNQPHNNPSIIKDLFRRNLLISIPRLQLPLQVNIISPKITERIAFSCKSCELSFNAYDRVVEHCQKHYTNKVVEFSGEHCVFCGLTYETKCSFKHSNLSNDNMDYVKVEFDLDFFIQDNSVWTQHLFRGVASDHKETLINNSIYKSEARIKMKIVQEGSANVTIYQCDKCGCCVPKDLYNHIKNACFNIRKHLCNTCGLAFTSYISKENHEYIHSTAEVGLKDYRIVTFNRKEDREYHTSLIGTLNKKYILNQCRNCNGIVNVTKFNEHLCQPSDLSKCKLCGLLIYKKDMNIHNEKHSTCKNYIQHNMKILLCGQIVANPQNVLLKPTFTGFICDYTFYKCAKCHGVGDFKCSNHVCNEFKIKCDLCDQLFLSRNHKKLHIQDTDFKKAHINIIEFNLRNNDIIGNSPINTNSSQMKESGTCVSEENSLIKTNSSQMKESSTLMLENVSNNVIYKCPICSLHCLDKQTTFIHLKSCNPKIKDSRQTCTKCGRTFTSRSLFNHLIKHHGNDNKHGNVTVIDIVKFSFIFKCSVCILHFTTYYEAFEHSIQCNGSAVGEKCTNCELIIFPTSLRDHNKDHLSEYKSLKLTVPVANPKAIEEMLGKFNDALNKRLELANYNLSKLNFSIFSNVLYYCEVCKLHLLDIISLYSHFLCDEHDNKVRDNCMICNLEFLLSDLTVHVFVHHKKWGLEKQHFVIIPYRELF